MMIPWITISKCLFTSRTVIVSAARTTLLFGGIQLSLQSRRELIVSVFVSGLGLLPAIGF